MRVADIIVRLLLASASVAVAGTSLAQSPGYPDRTVKIVDLLQREIARIVELPDVKDNMATIGLDTGGRSSAEFAAYVRADSGRR